MPPTNTVSLDSHAAATLRYIRASMEAAGTVALPGSAGIVMGLVGLAAALLSTTATLHPYWLTIWLTGAAVAALAGGALMARQSFLQGFTLYGAPVRKLILCLVPGLFAGAVLTLIQWRAGNVSAIPGTWLLLYGCALVSASAPTARIVGVLGGLFVLLGLIAFWLPESLQLLPLGVGFGALHLVFGVWVGRKGYDRKI
jgi:hypothetical protein